MGIHRRNRIESAAIVLCHHHAWGIFWLLPYLIAHVIDQEIAYAAL